MKRIAVVGSRRMTEYGRRVTEKVMEKLRGVEVVTIKTAGVNAWVAKLGARKIFSGENFEKINEEVAEYADKLVIIEGGKGSGTLLLAEKFVEKNKPVYCVPGRVTDENSWGCNWLISSGATPIVDWEDLTEVIQ